MSIRVSFTAIRSNARIKPDKQVQGEIVKYVADWATKLYVKMLVYPPAVAGSDYVRTYDLRKAWRLRPTATGDRISFEISNRVTSRIDRRPYATFVQGRLQSGVHAGHRWLTIDDAIKQLGGREGFRAGVQVVMNKATSEFRGGRG